MKIVQIDETRREVREDELRRLLGVPGDFGLAEVRVRERNGARSAELIFRWTRDHRDVSLDAVQEIGSTGNANITAG